MWPAAAGIALMSFTETHCRGARVWRAGRATARAESGTAGARRRQRRRWPARRDAGRRRHVADRGQPPGGRAQRRWRRSSPRRWPLATLLLLGPVIALMPQAALAAVVIVYSIELIKPAEFAAIRRVRRTEFLLGADRLRRRRPAGHAQGHPGGGDRLAALAGAAGLQSRRCTRSAASAAPRCSARARRSIPTTRRGRAC